MRATVKQILKKDFSANKDIRNNYFFYIYRYGHYFHQKCGEFFFYKPVDYFIRFIYRNTINKYNHIPLETNIGGLRCPHLIGIVLSGKASIGESCTIMHQVTIGVDDIKGGGAPTIGSNVFIGAGAKIIGDITIGNNVVIGAGAIVTKNISDGRTVVGINRVLTKETERN